MLLLHARTLLRKPLPSKQKKTEPLGIKGSAFFWRIMPIPGRSVICSEGHLYRLMTGCIRCFSNAQPTGGIEEPIPYQQERGIGPQPGGKIV